MDRENLVEEASGGFRGEMPAHYALAILDTADEYFIGVLREAVPEAAEVFVVDHHEPNRFSTLGGFIDSTASSTCELMVELAAEAGVTLTPVSREAVYAGLIYDTGSFAYPKTTERTFAAALTLVKAGVKPYDIYRELNENSSTAALLLQKRVLSTLSMVNRGRIAVQTLNKDDYLSLDARYEDAENFINIPLKSRDVRVSVLVKENREGIIRCSLRSKGGLNVSKVAQFFGGGGHVSAAGFKSRDPLETTLAAVLDKLNNIIEEMDNN
jgi:phosphoesterase RecJ-like protein